LFCEKRLLWDLNSKEVREFHNGLDGLELGERKRGRGRGEIWKECGIRNL
jgi:hypothetical protein